MASRYLEIVWNPLNVASHAPKHRNEVRIPALPGDSAVILQRKCLCTVMVALSYWLEYMRTSNPVATAIALLGRDCNIGGYPWTAQVYLATPAMLFRRSLCSEV